MIHSDKDKTDAPMRKSDSVAVLAELLFLSNLLIVPVFSFIGLLWYYRKRAGYSQLAVEHLQQTIS
ncbi:MAG: hypothetical protein OQK78_03860, partial [Gammaproteobacteria bacterium]|nr:hypothetical protein [Gammaproteobacteria bacterium]